MKGVDDTFERSIVKRCNFSSPGHLRILLLMLGDAICLVSIWFLVLLGYRAVGLGHYALGFYLRLWPVVLVFIVLNARLGLYHGRVLYPAAPVNPVEELRRFVTSSMLTHLGTLAVLAIARQSTRDYSRAVILISCVLVAFLAQPVRQILRALLKRFKIGQIPVVLIGKGASAERMRAFFQSDAHTGFTCSDVADVAVACCDVRVFRTQLSSLARQYTHVIFVPPGEYFPSLGAQSVSFDGAGGVEFVSQRLMRVLRVEKWLMDRLLAVVALIVLSPFFLVVPIVLKVTSKGPVFYRQQRLGQNGRPIRVWKFRSMYADADERLERLLATDPLRKSEWEESFKLKDDPRVTPVGRFLRKTSIDEFPQLFNVFSGDMALVGPRPIVAREVPYYGKSYETFASVKPGITGLWQVSGRSDTDYPSRVALDIRYVLNWSPWMDIWILFRTVGAVLLMRGAC